MITINNYTVATISIDNVLGYFCIICRGVRGGGGQGTTELIASDYGIDTIHIYAYIYIYIYMGPLQVIISIKRINIQPNRLKDVGKELLN